MIQSLLSRLSLIQKLVPTLMTTSLVAALSGAAQANTQAMLDQPRQMADEFLSELSSVRKRIDLVISDLNDPVLLKELQTLAKSKKQIRIILTSAGKNAEQGLAASRCVRCSDLESEGIDIRFVDTAIATPFAILDGPRTRFSSGRLGTLLIFKGRVAIGEGRQLIKVSRSGDYVLGYQDEFNHLWSIATDYDDRAKTKKGQEVRVPSVPGVFFTSANMVPVRTPRGWLLTPSMDSTHGVSENFIEGAVNYATRSIDVSVGALRNDLLYRALIRAHGRGVRVRVVVDRTHINTKLNRAQCEAINVKKNPTLSEECLIENGIQVLGRSRRLAQVGGYILIDDKLVLTGPVGLSKEEEFSTIDSLLVIRDKGHAAFARNFKRQVAQAVPMQHER